MAQRINLCGEKFGRWLVISYDNDQYWNCICECGNKKRVKSNHLRSGATKSCGCFNAELMKDKFRTHGLSKHPLKSIHNAIMNRCYNSNQKCYKYYGGRGIKVCERWHYFKNFYDDMINGYQRGLSIERDDVNGNYCKENCRWATTLEQSRNRTDNVFIEYKGEKMIMKDWSKRLGIENRTLWHRLKSGWGIERAFTETVKLGRR